jgi:hypothetical protein
LVVSATLQLPTGEVYRSVLAVEVALAVGIESRVITWRASLAAQFTAATLVAVMAATAMVRLPSVA